MPENTSDRPIVDLHCDLLHYLATVDGADPLRTDDIGCAIPHLQAGNVKLQVLAVFAPTGPGSVDCAERQMACYRDLVASHGQLPADPAGTVSPPERLTFTLAVENASALVEEHEPLSLAFERLQRWTTAGRLLYLSLTHVHDNRFGGAAGSRAGLGADGRALLGHLHGTGIAVDLSHASDRLIEDVLELTAAGNLPLPVIASHSNFRSVCPHPRNLPDWAARELISRGGLIGINLLREYLHRQDPGALIRHVAHGLELGGERSLCLGADFFCISAHPDPSRAPFFFPGQEHAGRYPSLLASLAPILSDRQLDRLAFANAWDLISL